MVVSETTGKDSSRRGSSASPIRERLRRKPRQDWLVTVGQGRSPARTLRRESKGRATSRSPGRSKKFDSARLSFGGLEQDPKPRRSRTPPQADDGTPSSPTTPEPRSRKHRPGPSPSSADSLKGRSHTSPMLLASVTSVATAPPTAASSTVERRSPAFPRSAAGVDGNKAGSPFGRSVELRPPSPSSTPVSPSTAAAVPKTDWLAAAISGGRGESGGEEAFTSPGGGGGAERRGRLDLSPWRARKPGQGLSPPRQASPSSSPRSLAKGDWRRGPAGVRPGQAGASRSLSPLAGGRAAGFGKTSSMRFGRGIDPLGAGFGAGSRGASSSTRQMPESCAAEREEAEVDADDDGANGKEEGGALLAEREEVSGEGRAEGNASDGTAGLLTVETKDFGEMSGGTTVVNNPAGAEHDDPLRPTLVVTARPSPLRAQLQSPITQDPSPCTSDGLHFAISDGIPPDGGPGGDAAGRLPPSPQATGAVVREGPRPPLHGNGGGFTGHVPPGVRIVGRTAAGKQAGAASGGGSDGGGGGGGGALAGEAPTGRRDRSALSSSPSSVCSEGGGTGPPRGGEVKLFVSTPTGEGDASDLSLWVTTRGSEEGGGEGAATPGDGAASPLPSPLSVRLSPVAAKSLEDDDPGIDAGDGASNAVDLEEEVFEKDLENGLGLGAKNGLEARSGDGEGGASGEAENEAEVLLEEEGATRCLLQPSEGPEAAEEAGGDNEDPETAVSQGEVESAAESLSGAEVPLLDSSKTIPSTTAETAANVEKTEVGGMEGPWEAVARVFCGIFNFCRPPGGEGGQRGEK
ncbi:hypothetical protein Esi_0014_0054 [Ectocarpus siliculosus]|uniref:Uncharacterized protein n=1 Tax=Ectocarpus siliculosus TaxID=2880 RepID=D8LEU0_ECTSI|nr:hypothetical protein Esi_0014_0054 [Ectocarpus siliculosus]|eukprot:CBN79760.1 hypothetical protein Esi_0014_0054 [Ectocarpus siliculosus]